MNKKKILIICCALLICILLSSCNNIDYITKDEGIIDVAFHWNMIGIVSTKGNCYVKGPVSNINNYGLEEVPSSSFQRDNFMCIYNKGDAVSISLSRYGGIIINEMNGVYIFVNCSQKYSSPTLLCNGYVQAYFWDKDHIYLLSQNGDFGYVTLDDPTNFNRIGNNVSKFIVDVKNASAQQTLFALTKNNRLYILSADEVMSKSSDFINGITDFDLVVPHTELCVFTLKDEQSNSYLCMGNYDLSFESLSDKSKYIQCNNNTALLASYRNGAATLDSSGNVAIYGSEPHYSNDDNDYFDYNGEILFTKANGIYGGIFNLIVTFEDGHYECFGRNSYNNQYTYFHNN